MNLQFEKEGYPFQDETYTIIGIAMEMHRLLGKGFSEIVYKDAFEYEFSQKGILHERERQYRVRYKDVVLPHSFFADFVVYDKIILEVKSKRSLIEDHYAQVLNYLAVSSLQIGLIINFHERSLEYKRVILSK